MDINSDRNRSINKYEVKVENSDEDFNEYAESTMNELLGWYGYENNRKGKSKMIPYCSQNGSTSSGPDSPKYSGSCDWCGRVVDDNKAISSAGAVYCSELCFSQSRRANFKKNKTCDWCRHVRHTISYVDFQDGASQLQFCSDKCLNQYKMLIFCRETKAHLKMHPHVPENGKSSGVLITPDLWLRNSMQTDTLPSASPPKDDTQTSPLPLISLVHPSKLIEQKKESGAILSKRQKSSLTQKKKRKRILPDSSCSTSTDKTNLWNDCPQDLTIKPPNVHKSEDTKYSPEASNSKMFQKKENTKPLLSTFTTSTTLPPVTVMVPYPIFVPVPLPIPIPFDSNLLISSKNDKNISQDEKNGKGSGENLAEDGCQRTIIQNCNEEEVLEGKEGCNSNNNRSAEKGCAQKPPNLRLRSLKKRKKILDAKRKSLQLKSKRIVST